MKKLIVLFFVLNINSNLFSQFSYNWVKALTNSGMVGSRIRGIKIIILMVILIRQPILTQAVLLIFSLLTSLNRAFLQNTLQMEILSGQKKYLQKQVEIIMKKM